MKLNRREFIKKSGLASLGLAFTSIGSDVQAMSRPRYQPAPEQWNSNEVTIAWIGHATVLMNFYGKWIITDPVLFSRVGVYFLGDTWGPTRYTAPALPIEKIPKPDIILLSHAHMDHMDFRTLKTIAERYPGEIDVVTSYLTKDVIEELPWKSIKELDWNESCSVNGVDIKANEVKHFGWRFPWEKDRSKGFFSDGRSYNAYLLSRNGRKVLFGGDTAFTGKLDHLKSENIDIAIMPIGAYRPWRKVHCNPEEALIMANKIKARYFIPIHCGTFEQGREPREEPLRWLTESAANYDLQLGLNEIGQTFTMPAV